MSLLIDGISITEACAKALVLLASSPVDLDEFDPRVPRTLAKNGLATIADETVTISAKGRAMVQAYKLRTGGETKPAKAETKPAIAKTTKPKRETAAPPQTLDLAKLRADLTQRYERDLAAIDRFVEIARELGE